MDDEALAACVAGLEKFAALPPEEREQPRYKRVRALLYPLIDQLRGRYHSGQDPSAKREAAAERRYAYAKRQREMAQDAALLNARQLRAARLDRLAKLTAETGIAGLIPDGVADSGMPSPSPSASGGLIEDMEEARTPASASPTPPAAELNEPRACYTCRGRYRELHTFYDALCPPCAQLNYTKRGQTCKLDGRIAIVTGARVKIGYQVALRLLRCGATVIATTRFPVDASMRYAAEPDAAEWTSRLQVVGLDFRDVLQVERFVMFLQRQLSHVDIIINNACQTVRRPAGYYEHLMQREAELALTSPEAAAARPMIAMHTAMMTSAANLLPAGGAAAAATEGSTSADASSVAASRTALAAVNPSAALSQLALLPEDAGRDESLFPTDALDVNRQQIDLRRHNSWLMTLCEVSTPELLEVMTINAIAPFVLNGKLKPLLLQSPHPRRYIINVSAMEGKFYRYKTPTHPHTNMAKAALNMMTRTSAEEYARDHIYMNAVDTGWINDEKPLEVSRRHADDHNFQTPLDEVDAMARILDPIMVGENEGVLLYGKFLKDYKETEW